MAARAVSHLDSDKEQVDFTKITVTLSKLKEKLNTLSTIWEIVWKFYATYRLYCSFTECAVSFTNYL